MDAAQVKILMNQRAEEVCRHLLPAGKAERGEWVVGDLGNKAGQSLRIHMEGAKCGIWADFSTEQKGGSLLDLWMAVRGCDFRQAIGEAKAWLGIREESWQRTTAGGGTGRPRSQSLENELRPVAEGGAVWRWLTETRKILPASVRAYRIGEARIKFDGVEHDCVVFPSFTPDGKVARLKFRSIADKKRMFVKPKKADGGFDLLFGWQAIAPTMQDLFITEGEIDALTFHSFGIAAVSLPMGAQPSRAAAQNDQQASPHDEWLEKDFERLQEFVAVVLALDNDEPGKAATRILVPRLGRMRCSIVQWPEKIKDANDARLAGMTDREFTWLLSEAKSCDPDELKHPSAFKSDVWELWHPTDSKRAGVEMPWSLPFAVRPGEVTIWQGYTKHGKTTALSHCLTHWAARHGHKALVASFEIPGANTIENVLRQATCRRTCATTEELDARLRWMDGHFLIYDYVGDAKTPDVLEVFEYAARKYGVQHVVLDSLMKIVDVEGDDFSGQRSLLNKLGLFADEFNLHVHLVAHSKKPDSKHPQEKCWPSIYDVMGSSYLVNLADNIVCVWRNVMKSQNIQAIELNLARERARKMPDTAAVAEMEAALDAERQKNDALFVVQGQRKTGETPIKNLWFDSGMEGSWQFRDDPDAEPVTYLK